MSASQLSLLRRPVFAGGADRTPSRTFVGQWLYSALHCGLVIDCMLSFSIFLVRASAELVAASRLLRNQDRGRTAGAGGEAQRQRRVSLEGTADGAQRQRRVSLEGAVEGAQRQRRVSLEGTADCEGPSGEGSPVLGLSASELAGLERLLVRGEASVALLPAAARLGVDPVVQAHGPSRMEHPIGSGGRSDSTG